MQAKVRRKRGSGEKFLRWELSIYRGEGGVVQEKRLDMTVASFPEDACPLQRSEGDVFYQNSKVFVETDRRSQPASPMGLVLGNSVKALHPRNVGFAKVREIHLMEDSAWLL
jgi:hypothetical protein